MQCKHCGKEMTKNKIMNIDDTIELLLFECEDKCEEEKSKINKANKPKMIEVKNEAEWTSFLKWYGKNIGEYEWHPIPPADRVNIYSEQNELVAYKYFYIESEFFVREQEHNDWVLSTYKEEINQNGNV